MTVKKGLVSAASPCAGVASASAVFINSDAWNFFYTGADWRGLSRDELKKEVEKDVDWYTDRGGVEAVFYNLNFQRCFWPTKAGTPYWKDLELDGDGNLLLRGKVLGAKDGADEYRRMYLAAKPMWEEFPEFIAYRYEYCHKKGIEMWHSLRVNDVHCAQKGGEDRPQHGDLWRTRPDLHRAEYRADWRKNWFDRGFDYSKKEVRDYHLALAKEYLLDYESDGMELDFMRHAPFFAPGHDELNTPLMTQFVRDVRKLCDEAEKKWGHKLRLAVRVPAYPADALGLGMDVPSWIGENLVDVVVPSPAGLETVSDTQVALWRALCPKPVVLAPCIDFIMQIRWEARMEFNAPCDYGFASSFYNQGADTVYFYNHYPRDRKTHPDMKDAFAICGDRTKTAAKPRRCVLTGGGAVGEGRQNGVQFPLYGIPQNSTAGGVKINVGDKVAGRKARIVLGATDVFDFDFVVNGKSVPVDYSVALPEPRPKPGGGIPHWYAAELPSNLLHDGWNLAELYNKGQNPIPEWRIFWFEIDVD